MTDWPTRRPARLPHYDYRRAGYYFVTICTQDKLHTLGSVVGADVLIGPQVQLSALGRLVEAQIAKMPSVDKYVIMPNHVHLIVKCHRDGPMGTSAPTDSLPKLMHYLKASVTKAWGMPIWQRSYYDHVIRDRDDYLRIWDYIDTNPAKWAEDCYYKKEE